MKNVRGQAPKGKEAARLERLFEASQKRQQASRAYWQGVKDQATEGLQLIQQRLNGMVFNAADCRAILTLFGDADPDEVERLYGANVADVLRNAAPADIGICSEELPPDDFTAESGIGRPLADEIKTGDWI